MEAKLESVNTDVAYLGKCLAVAKQDASLLTKEAEDALLAKERQQQFEFECAQF